MNINKDSETLKNLKLVQIHLPLKVSREDIQYQADHLMVTSIIIIYQIQSKNYIIKLSLKGKRMFSVVD